MVRPIKKGLKTFPFDIDMFEDLRVRKLIKSQGAKAVAVYIALLCNIYKSGYYIHCTEELIFNLSDASGCEVQYVREAIKTCLNIGLFSWEIYQEKQILTSVGIQKRVEQSNSRSKKQKIQEFSLLQETKANNTPIKQTQQEVLEIQVISILDQEIEELKKATIWLDNMQVLHKMSVDTLKDKIDEFRIQCIANGLQGHESIPEAKKHFNNWLRIVSNDKNRTNNATGRRGHILKADEPKTYSNSF